MSSQDPYRWAGAALMLGATAFILGGAAGAAPPPAVSPLAHSLIMLFALLIVVGLPGLYLLQRRQAGVLGLVGTGCLVVSVLLLAGFNYLAAFLVPALARRAPEVLASFPGGEWQTLVVVQSVARFGIAVGFLSLGVATYRAGVLPGWTAILAIVGGFMPLVQFAGFMLDLPRAIGVAAVFVMAAGLFGLGWGVWTSTSAKPVEASSGGGIAGTA
jgi:hypothetical protein